MCNINEYLKPFVDALSKPVNTETKRIFSMPHTIPDDSNYEKELKTKFNYFIDIYSATTCQDSIS